MEIQRFEEPKGEKIIKAVGFIIILVVVFFLGFSFGKKFENKKEENMEFLEQQIVINKFRILIDKNIQTTKSCIKLVEQCQRECNIK